MPDFLTVNPVFTLFLLLLIGNAIGLITVRGISLGSAGIMLTALVFGHLGLTLPKELTDLGLILFVYSVGLSAGPRNFTSCPSYSDWLLAAGSALSQSLYPAADRSRSVWRRAHSWSV
ncbi:MAG: aspartate-alanine antiporter-like transporter [Aggregatilineales bacterium]